MEVILQFDLALDAISFIHRIGRTGRLGKKGEAVNFVREKDQFLFSRIKEILAEKENFGDIFSRKRSLRKKFQRFEEEEE